MATKTLLTAEEYLELPDTGPSELVRGEVVEMSPPSTRHGAVCANVTALLRQWAKQHKTGHVACNDAGVITERDPDTVRGADCQFISARRLPQGLPERGYPSIPPDLAVEVVSDSDRWAEVMNKVQEYLVAGVVEVWVVEPREEFVQVFRNDAGPVRYDGGDELKSDSVLPGFRCRVAEFFDL